MMERTRGALWEIGKQLGFSHAEVIRILRNNGVQGAFDPEEFDTYVDVLMKTRHLGEKIVRQMHRKLPTQVDFTECPICGAPIRWLDDILWWGKPKADRWRCTVVSGHWALWRFGDQIRLDMERRRAFYDHISGEEYRTEVRPSGGGILGGQSEEETYVDGAGI